jgi:hypothetical protein
MHGSICFFWANLTPFSLQTVSVPFSVDGSMLGLRGAEGPAVATLALDVKAIKLPFSMFHW